MGCVARMLQVQQVIPGRQTGETQHQHTRTLTRPPPPAPRATQINPVDCERVLRERLREELGPERFNRYFEQGARLSVSQDCIEVVVPSPFMAERFSRQLLSTVRRVASAGSSTPTDIRVRIDRTLESQSGARSSAPVQPAPRPTPEQARKPKLTLRHRLDEFIVGKSNRLAYTAASRIAEGVDDAVFSPLFIHGPSGIGKTHLLQGIARRTLERRPGSRVRYVTAEAFTNEYIAAIRSNTTDRFRRGLRGVKLLCLDDVHFLGGKKSTQNELLHTLDAIGLTDARVVLASDEHPRRIGDFNEHLVSRFLSGAVVRIEEPDEVLCRQLVGALAARRELPLTEDGLAVLTQKAAGYGEARCGRSVREIEGLLNQVEAVRRLTPDLCGGLGPMDASAVRRALGLSEGAAMRTGRSRKPVRMETILREACGLLRVEAEDLFGKGRHRRVVLARGLIVRVARELTTMSYPEIARGLHRPNHSTVITANQRIGRQMEADTLADCGPDLAGLTIADLLTRIRDRVLEQGRR